MGGSKTAILSQVVHFYFVAVGHITIGGNTVLLVSAIGNGRLLGHSSAEFRLPESFNCR